MTLYTHIDIYSAFVFVCLLYFWLCWVFVVVSRGYSLGVVCASHCSGFSVAEHRL